MRSGGKTRTRRERGHAWGDAAARAWKRRALARLPQLSIVHHRRRPLRLVSRKSQPQSSAAHARILSRCGEVRSSAAASTIGERSASSGRVSEAAQVQS